MLKDKKEHPEIKQRLHPRNRHRERYDFKELIKSSPDLARFVRPNVYLDDSIDFFDPEAVKSLNKALLKLYYSIDNWNIPENYLCPSIPGRADYIHHIAEMLGYFNNGKIPVGDNIKCLDIGVGANCVYPLIGNKEYGWSFTGTDIDAVAIANAEKIIEHNSFLKDKVVIRLQNDKNGIFRGMINEDERFDLSISNPPFHCSVEEAKAGTLRKLSNLKHKKVKEAKLNFGGRNNELWCNGGERRFVNDMIVQSKQFSSSCFLFSTLISKQSNLNLAYDTLRDVKAADIKTIPMGQGNKTSRILAWTFLSKEKQKMWIDKNWHRFLDKL